MFNSVRAVKEFALAGNAVLTIRSRATGTRFTYRVSGGGVRKLWFVSVLTGPNNESDYRYFGLIRPNLTFEFGRPSKRRVEPDARSARAFRWFWKLVRLERPELLEACEVWHEGRCGRCGRRLTVPESVASGFGPECSGRMRRGREEQLQLRMES